MKKRHFSLILMLFLMLTVFGMEAAADSDSGISTCWWDDSGSGRAIACWDEAPSTTSYKIKLYSVTNSTPKAVGSWIRVKDTKYDFSRTITTKGKGSYYFTIYPDKGGTAMMIESDTLTLNDEEFATLKALVALDAPETVIETEQQGWIRQPNGTWRYGLENHMFAKNTWIQDGGLWYHFDSKGFMQTGWQTISSKYYYLEPKAEGGRMPQGACYIDCVTPDGFTVDGSGAWIQDQAKSPTGKAMSTYVSSETGATALGTVSISVYENELAPGKVREATFSAGSNATVDSFSFSTPFEQWMAGTPVIVTLNLTSRKNYEFGSQTAFSCSSATIIGNEGNETQRTITLQYIPKLRLESPTQLYLDDNMELHWNKVPYASRYHIYVYQDNSTVLNTTISQNHIDFTEKVTSYENVKVRVIAQGSKSNSSYFLDSTAASIDNFESFMESNTYYGTMNFDSDGKPKFRDSDGEKLYGWQYVLDKWYYFDENGNPIGPSQWYLDTDGNWYWMGEDYAMATGNIFDGNAWYFMNDGSRTDLPRGAWVH